MNKGISLVSLTITIVVAMIIASIVILPSIDIVRDSHEVRSKNEFMDIVTYVNKVNVALAVGDTIDNLSRNNVATQSEIQNFFENIPDDILGTTMQEVIDVNSSITDDNIDGYRYTRYFVVVKAKDLELGRIKFDNINLGIDTVRNDYLINFATGTVIAEIPDGEIKVLGEIKNYN